MTPDHLSEGASPAPIVEATLILMGQGGTAWTALLTCLAGAFGRLAPGGRLLLCPVALVPEGEDTDAKALAAFRLLPALLGRCGFDPAVRTRFLGPTNWSRSVW